MEENIIPIDSVDESYTDDDVIAQCCFQNVHVLDKDNLFNIKIDRDNFEKGVHNVSELCGAVSALVSVGVSIHDAFTYLTNRELTKITLDSNEAVSKDSNEALVNAAKYEKANTKLKSI